MNEDLRFNIYMSGVGGQGIGILSEVLIRSYDNAGYLVKGVDTHGLAQRGGMVESHLRVGCTGGNPLIEPGKADLAVSLERTEAYRAMSRYLRKGGVLVYYNTLWQTLGVRMGEDEEITEEMIKSEADLRDIRVYEIFSDRLPDIRMQNIALLSGAVRENVFTGISCTDVASALRDLFSGAMLEQNLDILNCG
ncbi:MAG: 2-oxoacid:acceptor oxidoreductase family protein [Spirochaetales bacterium]|nr:2-oxoacid:acceptor oxidoreductase family protein [Spirochaetales bacterium]